MYLICVDIVRCWRCIFFFLKYILVENIDKSFKSKEMEVFLIFINWLDNRNVVYIYNGIYLIVKKRNENRGKVD